MDSLLLLLKCMEAVLLLAMAVLVHKALKYSKLLTAKKGEHMPIPQGSLGWPLLGETLDFISSASSPHPESFMNKRILMYGRVFKSHLFGSPTIVSTDAEVNRFVLQGDANVFVPSYPKSLMELIGDSSILVIVGGLHKKVHGLIGGFLKSPQLKVQVTMDMHKYVESCAAAWEDKRLVYIQDEAKLIAFQVLVRGLISLEPGEAMQFLKQQFQEFIAGLISIPVKIPGSRLYRSLQAKKRMMKLIKGIVVERRRKVEESRHPNARDVIDVLLKDGSDQLTEDLISDNIIGLMIPGEESVPLLITLAVKYLSDCPIALRQVEEENMQLKHLKAEKGESITWADYVSLSFTQDVISETLRMGNIITGVIRKAKRDVQIKGHLIPKDWCVLTYFRSVHLDEHVYENPLKFDPWRWQNKDFGTCNFTPFGGGQRLCPGLDLARLEASIFLHHLVTNFTWVAEEDTVVNFPTVRMKRGMPIRVKRRGSNKSTARDLTV